MEFIDSMDVWINGNLGYIFTLAGGIVIGIVLAIILKPGPLRD